MIGAAAIWRRERQPADEPSFAPPASPEPEPTASPDPVSPAAEEPVAPVAPEPAAAPAPQALTAEEKAVLIVLGQEGRLTETRTVSAIAVSLERTPDDVAALLDRLSGEGLAAGEGDEGERAWAVTPAGIARLQSES